MQANEDLALATRDERTTPSGTPRLVPYTVQRWPLAEPAWTRHGTSAPAPSGTSVLEHLADRLLMASRARRMPRGLAWLDGGGPLDDVHRTSVITAFPTRVIEVAPDASAVEVDRALAALQPAFEGQAAKDGPTARTESTGPSFQGGWIGWFGYGLVQHLEPVVLARKDDLGLPLLGWAYHPVWFEYDDHDHTLRLQCLLPATVLARQSTPLPLQELEASWPAEDEDGRPLPGPTAWIHWAEEALRAPLDHTTPMWAPSPRLAPRTTRSHAPPPAVAAATDGDPHRPVPSLPRERFVVAVDDVRSAIREGEVFQANIAQRLEGPAAVDPFRIHVLVRRRNPSPFGAYLEGHRGAIVCNSPERLVAVDAPHVTPAPGAGTGGRVVRTRPIAGTRRRDADPAADNLLVQDLRASDKERAEHTMLVDLLRNDVGRICESGSVRVVGFQRVEAYSHVHHLVSDVEGRLRPDATLKDLLRALFPGGTITGAPKLRSIEVIDRVEPVARSIYTGSLGYVGHDGALDLNIMIRTLAKAKDRLYVWAGAGIVADSDGEREFDETLHKAAALMEAWTTSAGDHIDHIHDRGAGTSGEARPATTGSETHGARA